MPRVEFTPNLARQTHAPSCDVTGGTVAEALNEVFLQVLAGRLPSANARLADSWRDPGEQG